MEAILRLWHAYTIWRVILLEKGHPMRRASGIVSLTVVAVAIGLATLAGQSRPFDSPSGLAQGRQEGTSRGPRPAAKPYTTWQSYAGGAHSSQYSALDQINTKNVAKL